MALVTLSELLAQPAAASFMRGVLASGRFGNAYLLHGPPGVGKGTAALAFARALLCERAGGRREQAPAGAVALDDSCGTCNACIKTRSMQHPDLKFAFPVSGEERELDESIGEVHADMRSDPLHVFSYDKAASIRLSITRELLRELAFQPYEAPRRVVVMRDADRMREDQYSALLKSIEEPGAATVWVLTTSRLARLPATIRSRCQRVRLAAIGEATVREFLIERAAVDEKSARMLAALTGGNLARALELRGVNAVEQRDKALALLTPALANEPMATWKAAQGFMNFGRTGRETLRRAIEFHMLWLRDLLRTQVGAPRELLVHRDRENEIRRQAALVSPAELRRRLLVLEEALRAIEGNVTPELALFSAMTRVAGARVGEHQWPPHATARWDY
ncbi:MAG: AAA family ATPase [Candidatus Eisenbacteria bacterium]|uniref:AAA family ATPase n=1 Tax=Eiseniibacteriota bacterium TaxID=2212470 RepID=A0A849T067_UNCEI|nr:AAA family ATPase [Candidatus Eisenbacteria bacterium]